MNPLRLLLATSVSLFMLGAAPPTAHAYPPTVVVSQIYTPGGGGGGTGGFNHSFIELHNNSPAPVSLVGWSVQYSPGTGAAWSVTPLSGVIQPGKYYLVQQGNTVAGTSLPTPDAVGFSFMTPASGKVAVVASTLAVSNCPTGVVDLVGYGIVECFEGTVAQSMSPMIALHRKLLGCLDTDVNSTDFQRSAPAPRNSASPTLACADVPPYGTASIDPASVRAGKSLTFRATAFPGYAPPSSALSVAVDLTPIGGASAASLYDDGTHGDSTAGDNHFALNHVLPVETYPSGYQLTFTFSDPEARSSTVLANLTVLPAIVISQIYTPGGGGGGGSIPFNHSYIELHNRGGAAVSLVGWSLQYSSSDASPWQMTPLGGLIQPGQYLLVQMGNTATGAPPIPTPDFIGTTFIVPAIGKVGLFPTTNVADSCGRAQSVVDLLGYGIGACFEGSGLAQSMTPQMALFRKDQGCQDNDDNPTDFVRLTPLPRNSASPFVTCASVAPLGAAAATPNAVMAGNATLLTLALTPGQHPTSASYVVQADLSALGLPSESMHDDGLDGDVTAGDLVYSYMLDVPVSATGGTKTLPLGACDDQNRCTADDAVIEVQATTDIPIMGSPVAFALRGATPNPASGELSIQFSLVRPGPATLALIDVAGRTVASQDVGRMGPGEHAVRMGSARLAPGVYLVRLTQFGRSVGTRVVITR